MQKLFITLIAALLFSMSVFSIASAGPQYPNGQFIIETDQLAARIDDPNILIIDIMQTEMEMAAPGMDLAKRDYNKGHIKNAVFAPLESITTTVNGIPSMLPLIPDIEKTIGQLGINNDTMVVIYDDRGGLDAARLFWTLDYLGHEKMAILNGGIKKWASEGRPIVTERHTARPQKFRAKVKEGGIATAEWIVTNLKSPGLVLLDARTEAEYIGKDIRSKRGGHIPGAINIVYTNALNPDGTFKSEEELKAVYEKAGIKRDKTVVVYCQIFHRGSHTYYVLRLLGYPKVKAYDGSWAEWGNKENLPVTTEPHRLSKN